MADNIQLSCLIEGTQRVFDVFVSRNSDGNALREVIFKYGGKDWAPSESNLTMLKVRPVRIRLLIVPLTFLTSLRLTWALTTLRLANYPNYDSTTVARVSKRFFLDK